MTLNGHSGPSGDPAPNPQLQSELLTVAEVAAALRVSKMTIYRMVHSGQLPAVRVSRSFRIPASEAWAILRGDQTRPA
ncbi:MAG TPA: helix-turn-helix domain-containing protein [Pseudonocardia sp.]|jgi:excisionase family DNA binding protein